MTPPGGRAIPQTDLRAGYLAARAEIDEAVARVLASGWYILGKEVAAFEREFAQYLGVRDVIGVASGTEAIELALRALGIGPGDLVFTVSHTAVATVAAVECCGALPVLVDIDPATFTMDPAELEDVVEQCMRTPPFPGARPRGVIAVHLYGHPADLPGLSDVCGRHGLDLIEDCAQSSGAALEGRKTGTWGRISAFSFYPTKNLGAMGDGGAVATDDAALAERARLLQQYGWRKRYVSEIAGINSRLDELQAAILRVKLCRLEATNARRREVAAIYDRRLSGLGPLLPQVGKGVTHAYHQYVIRTNAREDLRGALEGDGIGTLIHYPVPIHLQPAYQGRLPAPRPLVQTEKAAAEILSLPMYPELSEEDVEYVCRRVAAWAQARRSPR